MTLLRIGIAALLCTQVVASAQDRPAGAKVPGKGDTVVAKGCLDGPTLQSIETVTTDDTGRLSTPLTYRLQGDKALLKRLREQHDGRQIEITGILKSSLPQDSAARSKTVGKTKVTFGIGTPSGQKGAPDQQPALPVLEVKSYEGAGARCDR